MDQHKERYFIPGDFYVFNYTTNQPLKLNGEIVSSPNEGPLLNWLKMSILLLNDRNEGDLAGYNLVGHKLAVKRNKHFVEKGQHTHYEVK